MMMLPVLMVVTLLGAVAEGANVAFDNCLNPVEGKPYFVPDYVDAVFVDPEGTVDSMIKYEVFGHVRGGQLNDLDASTNKYTTLKIESHVLQYELYDDYQRFCNQAKDGCPFGPDQSSFLFEYNVSSSYQGVSFDTTFYIIDSTVDADIIGCVSVTVSPVLADYVWYVLLFGILAVFGLLCLSYAFALYLNPWTGTKNIYMSTSNFGNDPNAIRLITPGAMDLLKYLQFAFFTGSLSLNFPGFFQPIMGSISWSTLLFEINVVTSKPEDDVLDGVYAVEDKYGLGRMASALAFIGNANIWPAFIIWLLVLTMGIACICLVGFFIGWAWRKIRNDNLDLRTRSLPFLGGVMVRIFLIAFGWPVVAYSFFELLIIRDNNTSVVADIFAAILLVGWVATAGWVSYRICTTSPRSNLFDDLSTVLLYGPLYNTYTEAKSLFFIIDLAINLIRGFTVGLIQDSGLAQITLLATTELAYLIALACLRPYSPITNMNFISIVMATIRLVQIFLLIPFVASLGINTTVRGWIAYVILIMHALVLIMCVIHVVQVVIEVLALMSGAVDTTAVPHSAPPGTVYGMKMLSKRKQKDGNNNYLMAVKDSGTHSPEALLWNQQPTGKRDDEADNDIQVSSPTSDTAGTGGTATTATPAAANTSSTGYYRRPRRRQSSHDWAYGVPRSFEAKSEERNRLVAGEEDFDFINDNKNKPNVNYAVREADVYFTHRRGPDSDYDDDEEEELEETNRHSENPLIGNNQDDTSDQETSGVTNSMKGILSKFKTGIKRLQNNSAEAEPEQKGFQVVSRRPIRPTTNDTTTTNDFNNDTTATSITTNSNDNRPYRGFDFQESTTTSTQDEEFTSISLHSSHQI